MDKRTALTSCRYGAAAIISAVMHGNQKLFGFAIHRLPKVTTYVDAAAAAAKTGRTELWHVSLHQHQPIPSVG